jgi:shikimate dehydrogenase/3-dehydroquinate dehydratase type I
MEPIVSLTPDCGADPLAALAAPPPGSVMVELRMDLLPDVDPAVAATSCPLPVLATLRSQAEGGHGPNEPATRTPVLRRAAEAGCALIDLEAERDLPLVRALGLDPERVVLSWHDPDGTPSDLADRCDALLAQPVRWVKIVPTTTSVGDLARVLGLHERHRRSRSGQRRLVTFGMGPVGVPSRFLAPLLGPPVMFVAWTDASAAAPGQLTAARLQAVIGHLTGPPRRVFGVVGADVTGSLSPALHAAGYRELGLPDVLLPFSVPDITDLALLFSHAGDTALDAVGLVAAGWAVTSPYKRYAVECADVIAPRARRARAANTLVLRPGRMMAENTDADGVVGSLTAIGVDPVARPAVVLGTGGAARGAAVGLDLAGANVSLRGRDRGRTVDVAAMIEVDALPPDTPAPPGSILVNATPLGSRPGDPPPFTPAEVTAALAVVEMVYGEAPTPLERLAVEHGVPVVSGREMLAHQGFAQFAAFTGSLPPRDAMRTALGLGELSNRK